MLCMIQQGVYNDYFDVKKPILFPIERLENGERLPSAGGLIWHGKEDSAVPVEGSVRFSEAVKKHCSDVNFSLLVRPGDHGFDIDARLNDAWVEEALKPYVTAWLV